MSIYSLKFKKHGETVLVFGIAFSLDKRQNIFKALVRYVISALVNIVLGTNLVLFAIRSISM